MAVLFQPEPFFFFVGHRAQIAAFCPWVTALLLLAFSLVFFFDHGFSHEKPLKLAFGAGAAGWFIMAATQSLAIINYFTAGRLIWVADLFAAGPIVFAVVSSISFLGMSVFFLIFAHEDEEFFSISRKAKITTTGIHRT
jgi:hypothetical protein